MSVISCFFEFEVEALNVRSSTNAVGFSAISLQTKGILHRILQARIYIQIYAQEMLGEHITDEGNTSTCLREI